MSSEAFTIVYNKALDLVSRREHSRHELRQKLNKRFPETSPIIDEALDKLVLNNILDDERFVEMYLNARARKGFGPKKIEMELYSKRLIQCSLAMPLKLMKAGLKMLKMNLKRNLKA